VDYSLSLLAASAYSESALQLWSKDGTEAETRWQARNVRRSSRSVSPEDRDNRCVIDTHDLACSRGCTSVQVTCFVSVDKLER